MVDSLPNKLVNVVSGVPQSEFGPIMVPSVHLSVFSNLDNELIGYADDRTLITIVISPRVRVTPSSRVSES